MTYPVRFLSSFLLFLCLGLLAGCAGKDADSLASKRPGSTFKLGKPYVINGVQYTPHIDWNYDKVGTASWYGPGFHGRMTANGEEFDTNDMTAAHPTLPLPSIIKVTNLANGKNVILRVNDRGPFHGGRMLDVSKKAATELGFINHGVGRVRVQILQEESKQAALKAGATVAQLEGYQRYADRQMAASNVVAEQTARADVAPVPPQASIQRQALPQSGLMAAASATPSLNAMAQPLPPVTTAPASIAAATPAVPPVAMAAGSSSIQPITGVVGGAAGVEALQPAYGMVKGGEYSPALLSASNTARNSAIYVQAGAFQLQENASRIAQRLKENSGNPALGAAVMPVSTSTGSTLFRVRLGPVANMEQANALLQNVVYREGQRDARIVVE